MPHHLPRKILEVFEKGIKPSDEQIKLFTDGLVNIIKERLGRPLEETTEEDTVYRMSNLGKGDRFLWYANRDEEKFSFGPQTKLMFLYGDVVEELMVFLADCAGYKVTDRQLEVEIDGVMGHIDLKLNGVPVDVKSASTFAFPKFYEGIIFEQTGDPFGYIGQISSYTQALGEEKGGLFAFDKSSGKMSYLDIEKMDQIDIRKRIKHLREILPKDEMPPKCYSDIPDGKKGNMKLHQNCAFCKYRKDCWSDTNEGKGLKSYEYKTGQQRHFTKIVTPPTGIEIKEKKDAERRSTSVIAK